MQYALSVFTPEQVGPHNVALLFAERAPTPPAAISISVAVNGYSSARSHVLCQRSHLSLLFLSLDLLLLYHHSWHLSRTFRPFLVIQNIKPQHVVVVGNEAPKKAKSVSPCETTTYANSAPGEFLENADKLNHSMLWFCSTKMSQMFQKRLKPRVGGPKGAFSREYLAKSPSFVSPCETMTYANSAPGNFC